jgi:hypothetical protein
MVRRSVRASGAGQRSRGEPRAAPPAVRAVREGERRTDTIASAYAETLTHDGRMLTRFHQALTFGRSVTSSPTRQVKRYCA